MLKKFKYILVILLAMFSFGLSTIPYSNVYAIDILKDCKEGANSDPDSVYNSTVCKDAREKDAGSFLKTLINGLLFILGAISVVVIIIGGIMYATSNGDPGSLTRAKDTVIYAAVGLIVAILAYAVVNFVISQG